MEQTSDLFSVQTSRVQDANVLDSNACFERIVDNIVTTGSPHAITILSVPVSALHFNTYCINNRVTTRYNNINNDNITTQFQPLHRDRVMSNKSQSDGIDSSAVVSTELEV